jgi:GNAT superfamily N-acetyltransferase
MKDEQLEEQHPFSTNTPPRLLIIGTGAIIKKMAPSWECFNKAGVKIFAADVEPNPQGLPALPPVAKFYNCRNRNEQSDLLKEARAEPFDLAYLSTIPELHLAEVFKHDCLVRNFIIPKPVDSHFGLLETLHAQQKVEGSYRDLVKRIFVHDHYRNKPLTAYLKGHMQDLHRRNGYLKNIRLYIVEHGTIQKEFRRRRSLECGMILDLAPHALSVVCELVPNEMEWMDLEGNTFKRMHREIRVVDAVRGRDNACILHRPLAETFAALHFRITETIHFIPKEDATYVDASTRDFDLLIVVGKGISLGETQGEGCSQDLKAIEVEFDGQIVRGNFDTNAVSGVIDEQLHCKLMSRVNPDHRGLNLPFLELAENGFSFENLDSTKVIAPFQSFEEAFDISRLLEDCHKHLRSPRDHELVLYRAYTTIGALLNRCVAMGLNQKWALKEDPTNLVFGKVPVNAIQ